MKIKIPLLIFFLMVCIQQMHAQSVRLECGADIPSDAWEIKLQQLIGARSIDTEKSLQSSSGYIIPVIFHIIHGGEPVGSYPNILQGQIISQITILNQDFSGNAYNASNYPSNAFVNWAINQNLPADNLDQNGRVKIADLAIQFCPATHDPAGNLLPEPGIDRINYMNLGLPAPSAHTSQEAMKTYLDNLLKPQTIWDVTRYLNVWVTDKNDSLSYAGVSSVPPLSGLQDLPNSSTDSTDGIWCFTRATGAYALFPGGTYISQFIDGRTLTHEAGHYVGLRHIWGDATCGNDFCNDTPPAADQNTGSPVYPLNAGSCTSPTNNPDGEMFMNFMDYTRGPSKYMFTQDQKTRAITVMQNSPFRNQLGTHNLCSSLSNVMEDTSIDQAVLFPNPATQEVIIQFSGLNKVTLSICNAIGQQLIFIADYRNGARVDLSGLGKGIYLLVIRDGHHSTCRKLINE